MGSSLIEPAVRPYCFTVEEYHRLGKAGVLQEDDRVELLNGGIFTMSPIGSLHAGMLKRLNELFHRKHRLECVVAVQDPLHLDAHSEPQPDLMLLVPREDHYASAHPRPDDVLLLIEVADASLDYDSGEKIPAYARAGIREVWLIDVANRRLTLHRKPKPSGSYEQTLAVGPVDRFAPLAFPEATFTLADLGW